MAITLQCPRCTHEQTIDDDKIGKDVPCKICHHLIATGGSAKLKPAPTPTATAQDAGQDGVKAGVPSAAPGKKKPPAVAPGKKRRDADEDRPVPRRRPRETENSSSSGMMMVLIAGGALLLLLVLCGGGGVVALLLFRSEAKPEEQIARNEAPAPINDPGPQPGPEPGPAPPPGPVFPPPGPIFQPPPPRPENLNPRNPNEIDRVFVILRGPVQQREPAYRWLIDADNTHPRRNQVAQQLERVVNEELTQPFTRFFDAYFRWITTDNVPSLMRFAESKDFADGDRRRKSMVALGKLKEGRAAEKIAVNLTNPFDGDVAQNALAEMGPIAQNAVLKYANDPDGRARERARRLLEGYGAKSDVYLAQCLIDLDAADANRRGAALQWLAKAQVDEKRRTEISRTLNKSLDNPDCLRNNDLVLALQSWGTRENVPKLVKVLDDSRLGNTPAIRILGKIGDPEGLKAVGRAAGNFFNHGEAKNALKEHGVKGEQAVIEAMNATADRGARQKYVQTLGEIGTQKVGGQALVLLAQRNQQDRLLLLIIQQELKKIAERGK